MKKKREPYRSRQRAELDEIEARRKRLGISVAALCAAADVTSMTWWRMQKSGLAFRRRVRALSFALRTIEQQRRNAEGYFP